MENIQVALRMRPLNKKEIERREENIWTIYQKKNISLSSFHYKELLSIKKINPSTKTTFCYDHCFTADDDNYSVYTNVVKRIALSSLSGINGTIFMYGQTGSGKTYTMMGYNRNEDVDIDKSSHFGERQGSFNATSGNRSTTPNRRYTAPLDDLTYFDTYDQTDPGNYLITEPTGNAGVLVLALRDIFETIEQVTV